MAKKPQLSFSAHIKRHQVGLGNPKPEDLNKITDEDIREVSSKMNLFFPANSDLEYVWQTDLSEMMFLSKDQLSRIVNCITKNQDLRKEFIRKCKDYVSSKFYDKISSVKAAYRIGFSTALSPSVVSAYQEMGKWVFDESEKSKLIRLHQGFIKGFVDGHQALSEAIFPLTERIPDLVRQITSGLTYEKTEIYAKLR